MNQKEEKQKIVKQNLKMIKKKNKKGNSKMLYIHIESLPIICLHE